MLPISCSVSMSLKNKDWEGCLSIPGIRAKVPRHNKIKVVYKTLENKKEIIEMRLTETGRLVPKKWVDTKNKS